MTSAREVFLRLAFQPKENNVTRSILYVEDEEDYQLVVRRILGKAGFHLRTAESCAAGRQALDETKPDLLLLDVNLPDGDGYAFCQALRREELWQDLPIVLLTVRRRPEEWVRGFSSGAQDYLTKPFNPPELLECVQRALDRHRPQRFMTGPGEYRCVQAAADGNPRAFEAVREKYHERLLDAMRVQRKSEEEAEDLTALAFARAYAALDQYRGEASFYTWLYRIALRESWAKADRIPHFSLHDPLLRDELRSADQENVSLADTLSDRELSERAKRALRIVPQPHRQILELYHLRDLPYQEISQRLRIPMGTVMSRLYKARRILRKAWLQSLGQRT